MKIGLRRLRSRNASRHRDRKWYVHPVVVSSVFDSRLSRPETPLEWTANGSAAGEIRSLINQEYDFEVWFKSDPRELRNWLKSYVTAKPEEALRLLAEMLQLAVDSRDKG